MIAIGDSSSPTVCTFTLLAPAASAGLAVVTAAPAVLTDATSLTFTVFAAFAPVTALAVMTDPDVACAAEAWVFSIGELSESASAVAGSSLAVITSSSLFTGSSPAAGSYA